MHFFQQQKRPPQGWQQQSIIYFINKTHKPYFQTAIERLQGKALWSEYTFFNFLSVNYPWRVEQMKKQYLIY